MIRLKPPQWAVFNCDSRFRFLVAGRRFGKTFLAQVELCRSAWASSRLSWYVAPTYKQAKRIAWKPLKHMTRPYWASQPNETDLRIELITGGTICLRGADNYDSLRGDGLDFLVLDEYASIAQEAWTEVLRPALADKQGRALFIGTPRGYNHFHDLYQAVQCRSEWTTFQFTTEQGGNVSKQELESAAHELDERTYRQEFQASFENLGTGRVYHAFQTEYNVQPLQFHSRYPLFWSLDFNVNPMCSVIGQQINGVVHVLDEIVLNDSHTLAACEAFLHRVRGWRPGYWPLHLSLYGDATGDHRHTSASRTDWQIVKDFLYQHAAEFAVANKVRHVNPALKDRLNCVNALLRNQAREHRLLVDPRCKELIRDFEQVCWKTDPHRNPLTELDKSDPLRTHVSDALGYLIAAEFSMYPPGGYRSEFIA
jgi:hypothetical protein